MIFHVLLIAAVLLPLAHVWSRIGLPKIARVNVCEACRYDLAGLPKSANCPECGSRARPSIRLYDHAPPWVTRAWLAGSLLANLPTFASILSDGVLAAPILVVSAAYPLVLLACFRIIARRPNKTAVVVAMVSTLGIQLFTQLFQILRLSANHRPAMTDWYALNHPSILTSAAGLGALSLIAILIIALTPDTDLTPPASP